jgi:signal transduction histidine kinase
MAAGLAHELNNPASAARRAASHLQLTVARAQNFVCLLCKVCTPAHWKHLAESLQGALAVAAKTVPLASITRSDREDELGGWLERQQVSEAWKVAPALVNAGLDAEWLATFVSHLPPGSANDAVGWLESNLMLKSLTAELEQSTGRVSELVKAVKAYSYMDQPAMQDVDVHEGLENTLTIMGHKLKGINVVRAFDRDLPHITAHGGELNQVWTNLLDNAIGSLKGAGTITISTRLDGEAIIVVIADDGAGIPVEIQPRIFEPFFTTKGVGTGTGLGLVISHRIIADRHGGEIEFESKPGDTKFKVRLPLRSAHPQEATHATGPRRLTGVR